MIILQFFEIRQIIYSLCWAKGIDTIFMNSGNSKTYNAGRLLLNRSDKINLKRSNKYVALSNLSIYFTWKNKNTKYWLLQGTKKLNNLIDHILYQLFKIILSISSKNKRVTDNLPIIIYVNKIKNRKTFRIKTGYYLKLLTNEKIKLLRSTDSKITKDKNGEMGPHLVINEIIHFNIINNDYQQTSRVLYLFVPNKSCCQLLNILPKNLIFSKPFSSKF